MWPQATILPSALLLSIAAASSQQDPVYAPFIQARLDDSYDANSTSTTTALPNLDLVKRATCNNCQWLGASTLCCTNSAVCSQDNVGNVACCPQGAVCTGTIGRTGNTASTAFVAASTTTTSVGQTTSTISAAGSATTTANGIVVVGGTGSTTSGATSSRSYVPNPYYPFKVISTTYTNAAACSSAYTACQTDLASCTSYLGGTGRGITVNAPNGGTTVPGPSTTYSSSFASSVCSSLSQSACSGLVVEACAAFGSGASGNGAARCTGGLKYGYGAGVGVAAGLVGQMIGFR